MRWCLQVDALYRLRHSRIQHRVQVGFRCPDQDRPPALGGQPFTRAPNRPARVVDPASPSAPSFEPVCPFPVLGSRDALRSATGYSYE